MCLLNLCITLLLVKIQKKINEIIRVFFFEAFVSQNLWSCGIHTLYILRVHNLYEIFLLKSRGKPFYTNICI